MKTQKFIFAVAVLFTIVLATSCDNTDIAEEEQLIQSIDRDEIKEEDT